MSLEALKQATTSIARRESFPVLLEKMKGQIATALPKHLNADRMARIALTEFRKNEALAKCDPMSVVASVVIAAQLGLEPGVMGQAYLVPYKTTCTLVPGWQGYVDLVSRAGRASVWTGAVRAGDSFEYRYGSSPMIEHTPGDAPDDAPFTHVYAVGRIKSAEWPVIEVWSRAKVERHLARYNKVGDRHYARQNENNMEMYGRKVALLQVIKYMPKSVELQTAASLDQAADTGTQTISLNEAIAGTFTPNGYDLDGEAQTETPEQRIGKLFDELHFPAEIRDEELARHKGKLDVLEAKLVAEKAKEAK